MAMITFPAHFTYPFLSGVYNGKVFTHKMHSATKFVMAVLGKSVAETGSTRCREPLWEYLPS